jgi:hypothetical protein
VSKISKALSRRNDESDDLWAHAAAEAGYRPTKRSSASPARSALSKGAGSVDRSATAALGFAATPSAAATLPAAFPSLAATATAAAPSAAPGSIARLRSVPHRTFEFPGAVHFQPKRDVFRWDIPHLTARSASNHQEAACLAKRNIAEHLYLCGLKYKVQDARGSLPESDDGVATAHHGATWRQQQCIIRIERADRLEIVAPKRLDEIVMELFEPSRIFTLWHERFRSKGEGEMRER